MAPIAMVMALWGAAPPAAADAKPCRTPCLSPDAQPAKPAEAAPPRPTPAAKPAQRPRPQPTVAAAPPPPAVEVAKRPAPSKRCTDINMRAAVGEPVSDEDMKILRSQC